MKQNNWHFKDIIIIIMLVLNFAYMAGIVRSELSQTQDEVRNIKKAIETIQSDSKDHIRYNIKLEEIEKRIEKLEK